jgi:hypothetical protein
MATTEWRKEKFTNEEKYYRREREVVHPKRDLLVKLHVKLIVGLGERGATLAADPTEILYSGRNRRLVRRL